jgi:FkbM family methyltransferase
MNKEELDLSDTFMYLQKELCPTMSIEVGAHNAEFSKAMLGKIEKIYAFEASPDVHDRVVKDLPDGIKYLNLAVSDKAGIIKFEIQERTEPSITGNNTIKNRLEDTEYRYVYIKTVSLDDYFVDMDENICLWIDVEGANEEVLLGAKNILKKVSSIHIEVETIPFWKNQWLYEDVSQYLAGYGFKEHSSANVDIYGHQKNIIYLKS